MRSRSTWLKVAITSIIFVFIFKRVDFSETISSFHQIRVSLFAIAATAGLLSLIVQTDKWRFLLQQAEPEAKLIDGLRSFFCGMALGIVSPGRAGEFGRAIFVKSDRRTLIVEMTVVDKISSVTAIFGLSAPTFWYRQQFAAMPALIATALALSGVCIFWNSIRSFGKRAIHRKKWAERIRSRLGLSQQHDLLYTPWIGTRTLLWAGIMYALVIVEFYLLILSFEAGGATQPIPFGPVAAVYPAILLINLIPITFAGLGMREGAAILLLQSYNVSEAAAVNSAFLLFFLNIFIPSLVGGLWILIDEGKPHTRPPA
ncbi:MAG: hypothetical protein B6244_06815 [Candidatus Cloacimonetes bacterium 4572_55]|nr:MAG: hypothetical protein B6244_06815 [Candidatus Cloacimonetes bacterium 4572_55]